jgi:Tectonin domain
MSRKNVSRVFVLRIVLLKTIVPILACWALLGVPAAGQHFEQVKGTLTNVFAGRNEVFGVDSHSNVWRLNTAKTAFVKIAGASLEKIRVGGGTVEQLDEVWGLDNVEKSPNVYRFNYTTKAFDRIPGAILSEITVGPGYQDNCHPYEVWGFNASEQIFRYDYCKSKFTQIPGSLIRIATGGGDVWGLNSDVQTFHYSFSGQAFVQVPGISPNEILVGVNDVWGLTGFDEIYRYDSNSGMFNQVSGTLQQIAVGGDGVWGINLSGDIVRFDPSSESFLAISGASGVGNIAVGSGAGVFVTNSGSQVLTFVRP